MHIIEELKEAEKTFLKDEDQQQIKAWKIQAHEMMNIESLESIEGIKIFEKWLNKEKEMIESQLKVKRDSTELERALSFKRIDWIEDVLGFFKDRDIDKLREQIKQLI